MLTAEQKLPASPALTPPAEIAKVAKVPSGKASICKPSERAPAGWKRFKIRGETSHSNQPTKYVLAKTQAEAEAEYYAQYVPERDQRLDKRAEELKKDPWVQLIVQLMPD